MQSDGWQWNLSRLWAFMWRISPYNDFGATISWLIQVAIPVTSRLRYSDQSAFIYY